MCCILLCVTRCALLSYMFRWYDFDVALSKSFIPAWQLREKVLFESRPVSRSPWERRKQNGTLGSNLWLELFERLKALLFYLISCLRPLALKLKNVRSLEKGARLQHRHGCISSDTFILYAPIGCRQYLSLLPAFAIPLCGITNILQAIPNMTAVHISHI